MKTQLLQDLNESGSANARPPSPEAARPAGAAEQRDAGVRPPAAAAEAASLVAPATPAASAPAPASAPAAAAAPAPAPAPKPAGPAVWHRPQQAAAGETRPREVRPQEARPAAVRAAPPAVARPDMPRSETPRPAAAPAAVHPTIQPRGFAPQPLPPGTTVPAQDTTITARYDGDPDWLTERLARDTAVHEGPEWNGVWTRRLASWGAAGVLLALVAAGGLWLYEQSQVEGALTVVANTNPAAPAADAERTVAPRSLPALPPDTGLASTSPVTASAPVPAAAGAVTPIQAPPAAVTEPAPAGPIGESSNPSAIASTGSSTGASTSTATGDATVEKTVDAAPVAAVDISAPTRRAEPASSSRRAARDEARKRTAAHKQGKTVASAAVRDTERASERSYRQRYEETLMQCRAHGYDERQCLQRGCEMTRFGFACKG